MVDLKRSMQSSSNLARVRVSDRSLPPCRHQPPLVRRASLGPPRSRDIRENDILGRAREKYLRKRVARCAVFGGDFGSPRSGMALRSLNSHIPHPRLQRVAARAPRTNVSLAEL